MEPTLPNKGASKATSARRKKLVRLGWLAFASWIFMSADGLLPQAQAAIFGGRVVMPNVAVKFVFLAVLLICALYGRHLNVPWRLRAAYFLFVSYLAVDALILFFFWPPYSLEYVLFGYNAYYFFLAALGVFSLTGRTLRESTLAKAIFWMFLPLGVLGIAQHATGLPLLPVMAGDGAYGYQATSFTFFGEMRAFSLFADAWEFGVFASLVGCISLSRALFSRGRGRYAWTGAFLFAGGAAYCTLTRMIYLEFLLGCISVFLIWLPCRVGREGSSIKWLPIAYGICAVLIVLYLGRVVGGQSGSLNDIESLVGRQLQWSRYLHAWTDGSFARFLFGTGVIQNTRFEFSHEVVIDNTYLGVATEVGFIGLVLWLYLMWRIWLYLVHETLRIPTEMRVALAAFFSTWLATGMFAIVIGQFAVALWLYLAAIPCKTALSEAVSLRTSFVGNEAPKPLGSLG